VTEDHDFHGSMTMSDGSRVALSADEAKAIWDAYERAQAERAERLPDTNSALAALSSAHERLRELGWHDSRHCPRDGSQFAVCETGSTGIWTAFFSVDYIHYSDSCITPGRSTLWKPLAKLTDDEKATMAECAKSDAEYIERLGRSFGEEG
jgi:hypothetical protein